jgi:metal-sulfur cluster biosynthetic enzyme
MPTREDVKTVLDTVLVPGVLRSPVKMNLVRDVSVFDGKVGVTLANAALMEGTRDWLKDKVKDAAAKLDGVKEVNVS